jgi:transposase InsO family protein
VHVYWDPKEQKVGAYRTTLPDYINDADDLHPYEVEGPNGVAILVEQYEKTSNTTDAPPWPTTEQAMRDLQLQDPTLRELIEAADREQTIEVAARRGLKQHKVMTPLLRNGLRGALRIQHVTPPLKELRQYEAEGTEDIPQPSRGGQEQDQAPFNENHLYAPAERQMAEDDPFYSETQRNSIRQKRLNKEEVPDAPLIAEPQVWLPAPLHRMCLNFFHEGLGHPGTRRTLASIMTKYYWDGMTKHVHEHCNACRHCLRRKIDTSQSAERPPQRNPISTRPMQTVHADFITNMPLTMSGNTIISVCVDAFTGWLMLSAHGHKDADTIARELCDDVFLKFGIPEVLRTDNGTEFRNGTMRAIEHLLHIRHSATTPYTPQANGKAETRNKTIYDLLVSMCAKTIPPIIKNGTNSSQRWHGRTTQPSTEQRASPLSVRCSDAKRVTHRTIGLKSLQSILTQTSLITLLT